MIVTSARTLILFWISTAVMGAPIFDGVKRNNSVDCPAKLLGIGVSGKTYSTVDALKTVIVGNASARTIVGIRLGWIIVDLDSSSGGEINITPVRTITLAPGEIGDISDVGALLGEIQAKIARRQYARGGLHVGVVQVDFQDGGSWRYGFGSNGRFIDDQPDSEIAERFRLQMEDRDRRKSLERNNPQPEDSHSSLRGKNREQSTLESKAVLKVQPTNKCITPEQADQIVETAKKATHKNATQLQS